MTIQNTIIVYISFLRKKLRFIKASVQIVTTKNVGYSLEENENGKKIRFKFVMVTMSLMTVVFGLVFLADFFYESYLYRQDTIQLLNSVTDSKGFMQDIFFSDEEDYFPEIFAVEFDENGQIQNIRSSLQSDIQNAEIKKLPRIYI